MTDNLRFKVDQILEYMQNEYLSLSAKLDQIITLLGGVPPESTVTLQDVVNAITAGNSLLTDIKDELVMVDQRVNRLELGLTLPIGSGVSSVQSNMNDAVEHLSTIITLLNAGELDTQTEALQTLVSQLANIRSSIGVLPTAESTPVRDLLISIRDCVCDEGLPPDGEEGELCTVSQGTTIYGYPLPDNPGIGIIYRTVTWTEAPEGTQFVSEYDITATNAVIEPIEDWLGWTIYVQSSASYFQLYPGALTSDRTNEWIAMPGSGVAIAPSVLNNQTISVTLCPPAAPEAEPCLTSSSEAVGVDPSFGYTPRQMAIFPTRNPQPTFTWPGGSSTTIPSAVHYGELGGHVIHYVSGRVRVVHGIDGVETHSIALDAPGESVTLPPGTEYVAFDDHPYPGSGGGTGAFTVEWCEPEEA